MSDRLPTPAGDGFQPSYDLTWRAGRQAELFVENVAEGLANGTVEVKGDARARDRVFIEYACRWSDDEWRDSGILTTDAEVWAVVLRACIVVCVPTWALAQGARAIIATGRRASRSWGLVEKPRGPGDEFATRGVVVPISAFPAWVCSIVDRRQNDNDPADGRAGSQSATRTSSL